MSDGAIEFVFELYALNSIQVLLKDCGREVIYHGKIKEAEGIPAVGCMDCFTVAVTMSKIQCDEKELVY